MDEELFDLCKGVYASFPEWSYKKDDTDLWIIKLENDELEVGKYIVDNCCWMETDGELTAPLYTSDYILENLPPVIFVRTSDGHNNTAILTVWINGDNAAHVAYMIPFDEQNRGDYAQKAGTPLKALLKLTLALKQAGEL